MYRNPPVAPHPPVIIGVDCIILPTFQKALDLFSGQIPESFFDDFRLSLLKCLKIENVHGSTKRARVVLGLSINESDLETLRTRFIPASINGRSEGKIPIHEG